MSGMGVSHFKISGTDLFSLPATRLLLAHLSVLTDEMVFIAWARLLWGLHITPTYTAARNFMRDLRRVALLPTDFLRYPDSSYLQEFVHVYDNEELIIFDTETTGLDVYHDDIIQIAAVRVRQGKVVGKPFNVILETDKELPETVGGHPNPMIEVYRTSKRHPRAEGLQMFLDYCKGKVLVGHNVEYDYQRAALQSNKTVATYEPHFGHIELHGWNLERYVFHKLQSGDYMVSVTAGDRVTGGSRDFFITPYCFEAKTYGEFLDRYLEIVPDYSFGLGKKELLPDNDLKEFLGY